MIVHILLFFSCSSPENQAETILKNLSKHQEPCSVLMEGKPVPPQIQKGACAQEDTVHLTLHRDCPQNIQIHSNALGWWSNDGIFHKGKPSEEKTKNCQWR